jgi:hypothetical protein
MRSCFALVAVAAAVVTSCPVLAQTPASVSAPSSRAGAAMPDTAAVDMARRQELVPRILDARAAASGRAMSPQLRGALAGKLMAVPVAALEALLRGGGIGDIEALGRTGAGPRVLGDTAADLVFTPVTPCRIIDTTLAGGPIPAGSTRDFYVNGNAAGTFESQGGAAGGCGIPDDATSVEMNFVAVGPAGPGDFRAFPWNPAPVVPNASIINYASLPGLNIANGLAQPVCNFEITACTFDLTVQADVSASHLVVDVVGFYRRVDASLLKSFSVVGLGVQGTANPMHLCENTGGLFVTITAPAAGTVVLNATTTVEISHVTTFLSEVDFFFATSPTACTTSVALLSLPPTAPSGVYYFPAAASHRFSVAAGSTTTFYLGIAIFGGGTVKVSFNNMGAMTAIFIPD